MHAITQIPTPDKKRLIPPSSREPWPEIIRASISHDAPFAGNLPVAGNFTGAMKRSALAQATFWTLMVPVTKFCVGTEGVKSSSLSPL